MQFFADETSINGQDFECQKISAQKIKLILDTGKVRQFFYIDVRSAKNVVASPTLIYAKSSLTLDYFTHFCCTFHIILMFKSTERMKKVKHDRNDSN